MSSFKELKDLERMIDSEQKSPRFAPQERVVGFQTEVEDAPPVPATPSIAIPKTTTRETRNNMPSGSVSPVPMWTSTTSPEKINKFSTSLPSDFITYKSQLSGWSGEIPTSPPKSTSTAFMGFKVPKDPPIKKATETSSGSSSPAFSQPESPRTRNPQTDQPSHANYNPGVPPLSGTLSVSSVPAKGAKQSQQPQQQTKKPQQQQPKKEGKKAKVNASTTTQEDKDKSGQQSQTQAQPVQSQQQQTRKRESSQSQAPSPALMQFDDPKRRIQAEKKKIVQQAPVAVTHQVALFLHLPQYERSSSLTLKAGFDGSDIHPAILKLGLMYANFKIAGSNARAVAMLTAFKEVISGFSTHKSTLPLHRELDLKIKPLIQFLIDCRPMSISMGNAINYLKQQMSQTVSMAEEEAKEFLLERIDGFIQERIVLADQVIATFGVSKINNGDVILTFARSCVVEMIIKKAFDEGKKFRVIVADSRPKMEGRGLLTSLTKHGVSCTYILMNGISYIMKEVTKVFVGAYSMLSNGALVSRVGTAVVAGMAAAYNVPVIVCCETYKFTDRVQLDSICFNQLGDPDDLIQSPNGSTVLKDWRNVEQLKLLNLLYDLTPMQYIMMVITEVGMIPPTSVPVILREYRKEPML